MSNVFTEINVAEKITLLFFVSVFSDGAALGQVQSALEHRSLHRGHRPQEQIPLDGCQRLQPKLHLPRHRVLGVSYIRPHVPAHLHNQTEKWSCVLQFGWFTYHFV